MLANHDDNESWLAISNKSLHEACMDHRLQARGRQPCYQMLDRRRLAPCGL
eukprot:c5066_g1_i1 orf=2-151(-)